MKWAARLRADLRQGKSVEYYITIPAALLMGFLSLFGLGQAFMLPLTLAVLALLAGGMLGSRHQVEELVAKSLIITSQLIFSCISFSDVLRIHLRVFGFM